MAYPILILKIHCFIIIVIIFVASVVKAIEANLL